MSFTGLPEVVQGRKLSDPGVREPKDKWIAELRVRADKDQLDF